MRSPIRRLLLLVLLVLACVAGWYLFTTPGRKPVVISVYEPPIIYAEKRVEDIGKVQTDTKVPAQFLLYNIGGKYLRIADVETSCGCTVAKISKKLVAPGDFTRLDIELDTSIKIGKVNKQVTVKSNDPKRPDLHLFLVGEVLPKPVQGHAAMTMKASDPLVLFKGECATCHVQAGKGKTGKALFLADCAMCHGSNAQGNKSSGVNLLNADYENEATVKRLRKVIAEGSPHSPQMPPFSKAKGGPLSDDEIDSLMSFLKFQASKKKMGLMDEPDQAEVEDQAAFEQALKDPH